jgi:hypothetical protein
MPAALPKEKCPVVSGVGSKPLRTWKWAFLEAGVKPVCQLEGVEGPRGGLWWAELMWKRM